MSVIDVDKYRQPWESDEHWLFRKEFIETYKDRFEEDRLLCLAQVFSNVEILGCSYPKKVMMQISELSKEIKIVDDWRDKRSKRKVVKFVASASAVKRGVPAWKNSPIPSKQARQSSSPDSSASRPGAASFFCQQDNIPSYYTNRGGRNDNQGETKNASPSLVKHLKKPGQDFYLASPSDVLVVNLPLEGFWRLVLPGARAIRSRAEIKYNEMHSLKQTIKEMSSTVEKFDYEVNNPQGLLTSLAAQYNLRVIYSVDLNPVLNIHRGNVYLEDVLLEQSIDKTKEGALEATFKNALLALKNNTFEIVTGSKGMLQFSCIGESKDRREQQIGTSLYNMVLIDDSEIASNKEKHSLNMLHRFSQMNRVAMKIDLTVTEKNSVRCQVIIANQKFGEAFGETSSEAKLEAVKKAIENLKTIIYTVKLKKRESKESVSKEVFLTNPVVDDPLQSDNIGFKMLKLMGWNGGGIGKEETGISTPITVEDVFKRHGIGYVGNREDKKEFKMKIKSLLYDFMNTKNYTEDIVFSADFSKEERAQIHKMAQSIGLKSVSRNNGTDRFLIVKHRFNPMNLIRDLIKAGGSTDKYELLPPKG